MNYHAHAHKNLSRALRVIFAAILTDQSAAAVNASQLLPQGEQLIDEPLFVQNRKGGERHVIVSNDGKSAQTRVQLSRKHGKYSLLQCSPLTGRTHQIRVHLEHYDHPLLGDERYGEGEANRAAKKLGLKRLFLHAQSIAFPDKSGNELHFTSPLAEDLENFLARLARR